MNPDRTPRSVLLVEGTSDAIAITTLALRLGINLPGNGVAVVEMGGATQIGPFLDRYGPRGLDLRITGLYDAGEAGAVGRILGRTMGRDPLAPHALEPLGFYMCVNDLEEELIRAVGMDTIELVARDAGDLRAFRTFQRQPEWRDRPLEQQFRRFLGSGGSRKIRYASLLVEALDLTCAPEPLESALNHALLRD